MTVEPVRHDVRHAADDPGGFEHIDHAIARVSQPILFGLTLQVDPQSHGPLCESPACAVTRDLRIGPHADIDAGSLPGQSSDFGRRLASGVQHQKLLWKCLSQIVGRDSERRDIDIEDLDAPLEFSTRVGLHTTRSPEQSIAEGSAIGTTRRHDPNAHNRDGHELVADHKFCQLRIRRNGVGNGSLWIKLFDNQVCVVATKAEGRDPGAPHPVRYKAGHLPGFRFFENAKRGPVDRIDRVVGVKCRRTNGGAHALQYFDQTGDTCRGDEMSHVRFERADPDRLRQGSENIAEAFNFRCIADRGTGCVALEQRNIPGRHATHFVGRANGAHLAFARGNQCALTAAVVREPHPADHTQDLISVATRIC